MDERIKRLEKAVEWMGYNLRTYGGGTIFQQVYEILHPADPNDFLECDECRAKPGSPQLCKGCLSNRSLIEKLKSLQIK